jgi:predicted nucleotidyltransferase
MPKMLDLSPIPVYRSVSGGSGVEIDSFNKQEVLTGMHDEAQEIDKRIVRFFESRPEIVAVYLFGSRARGRAKETSDVDLAVLIDPNAKIDRLELKRDMMIGLSGVLRKEIHPVILNSAGELLSAQVFKYGKCLYNREPGILSRFRTVQYSKIADFAYLRNIMQKGFTRKIMEGER